MKILEKGYPQAVKIIEKKVKAEGIYRLSGYVCSYSEGPVLLLRNLLTGMTAEVSEEELPFIKGLAASQANDDTRSMASEDELPFMKNRTANQANADARHKAAGDAGLFLKESYGKRIRGIEISDSGLEDFARFGFLIEEGTSELEEYRKVAFLIRTMAKKDDGVKTYTILPTTGCNARCMYCYEEGMKPQTMREDVADQVSEFIARTRRPGEIRLDWFGGEPLLAEDIISRICGNLQIKEIPFCSRIITNGVLATPALLDRAISDWNLVSAQVSVDGARADYEARKRFYRADLHDYEAMMRAVGCMIEKNLRVTLRCNCDLENIEGMKQFFDDLRGRFGTPENLNVYMSTLFQAKTDENSVELFRRQFEMYEYAEKTGLTRKRQLKKSNRFKTNLCMADSDGKNVVIDPEGMLYHCEHIPGNKPFGSVFDPQVELCSDERAALPVHEDCRVCRFLPRCTPFFHNGCPDWFPYCMEYREIEMREHLSKLLTVQS